MNPITSAIVSVLLITVCRTVIRMQMRGGSDPTTLLLFNNLTAALLLLAFIPFPNIFELERKTLMLVGLSSALWISAQVCDIRSHKYLDLAVNAIFSTARYLVLTIVGVVTFGEQLNALSIVGVVLISASMIWNIELGNFQMRLGILLKLISVVATTLALSTDKYLTTVLAPETVALLSFVGPALFYLCTAPRKLLLIWPEIKASRGWLPIIPLTLASYYYFFTKAMGHGDLAVTIAISQTSTALSFIAGYLILNERTSARRRAIASLLCLVGAYLVSAN